MARLRLDNIGDPTGATNPITLSDPTTPTVRWRLAPGFPTITGSDYYVIISEPGTESEEISYLVAFTQGATTGTVVRAQEGTTGIAHVGKPWVHTATALDFGPAAIPSGTYDASGAAASAEATEAARAEGVEAGLASTIAGLGTGSVRWVPLAFAYNASGILNGAGLYAPTSGDWCLDTRWQVVTAWNGLTPQCDFGTLTGGTQGALGDLGASPIDLTKADADFALLGNGGMEFSFRSTSSLSGALENLAAANATPVLDSAFQFDGTNQIKVVVSQDGTNQAAVAATCTAAAAPGLAITTSPEQFQFAWAGSPAGGASIETFSFPEGVTYTTLGQLAAAMNAATGTTHATFSQVATVTVSGSVLKLTAATAGFAANGNQIEVGNQDISAALGFTVPSILAGGKGGDPGATQGAAILYLLVATPS